MIVGAISTSETEDNRVYIRAQTPQGSSDTRKIVSTNKHRKLKCL